jgi:hypothetical protein
VLAVEEFTRIRQQKSAAPSKIRALPALITALTESFLRLRRPL